MKIVSFLFTLLITQSLLAENFCSRVAYVNYQEILVDSSNSVRGDGLKFYLSRDPVAKEYFDLYQKNSQPSWKTAVVSTLGLGLAIAGFFRDKDQKGFFSKNLLISSGIGVMIASFGYSKSSQYENEFVLERAVQEYNKRNNPKIYFSPFQENNGKKSDYGINFGYTQEF